MNAQTKTKKRRLAESEAHAVAVEHVAIHEAAHAVMALRVGGGVRVLRAEVYVRGAHTLRDGEPAGVVYNDGFRRWPRLYRRASRRGAFRTRSQADVDVMLQRKWAEKKATMLYAGMIAELSYKGAGLAGSETDQAVASSVLGRFCPPEALAAYEVRVMNRTARLVGQERNERAILAVAQELKTRDLAGDEIHAIVRASDRVHKAESVGIEALIYRTMGMAFPRRARAVRFRLRDESDAVSEAPAELPSVLERYEAAAVRCKKPARPVRKSIAAQMAFSFG